MLIEWAAFATATVVVVVLVDWAMRRGERMGEGRDRDGPDDDDAAYLVEPGTVGIC
jgi:hypothetical protein